MIEAAVKWLFAYLLGSVMGALLVGRVRGVDIREQGSGNAGGTNALRTQGKAFALAVVLIDVGKGVLAAGLLPFTALPGVLPVEMVPGMFSRDWLAAGCAMAVVVGHVYPVWYDFRGGKGAATVVGVLLGLAPLLVVPVLVIWLVVACLSGFVGLSTTLAMATLPVWAVHSGAPTATVSLTVGLAAFIGYAHRSNFARMRAGTENRARRLWLFAPRH